MGNHLLDSRSPELKDSLPFGSTFIYGAYDGELIFWEPMITLELLRQTREACLDAVLYETESEWGRHRVTGGVPVRGGELALSDPG